jgi:hypothetical protein
MDNRDVLERSHTALENAVEWEQRHGVGINLKPIITDLANEVRGLRAALCICVPDDHDILNGGLRDDCTVHGDLRADWSPGRWWRVTYVVSGERKLWCETSDEEEVRDHLKRVPFGVEDVKLERLWERHESEWRSA